MNYQLLYLQQQALHSQQPLLQANYFQLIKHPNFIKDRSPFYSLEKRVCVMPVFSMKKIQWRITLDPKDVSEIQQSRNNNNQSSIDGKHKELHMRLFGEQSKSHQEWSTSQCDVSINGQQLIISRKNTKTPTKHKGYNVVKPLDISDQISTCMDIELTSNGPFQGAVVVEVVRVASTQDMVKRVIARSNVYEIQNGNGKSTAQYKKCAICDQNKDLLRCSRCKGVWYCGTAHQAQDWPFHQTICQSAENRPKLKELKEITSEDEISVGQTKVSLRCPLSIMRIQTPVRGCNCAHPQCVDLETYVSFSHRTGNWQCPVCTQPLKYEELCVDHKMQNILKTTSEDIDTVRLNPDGTYQIITLEEQMEEEKRNQDNRRKKKRKLPNDSTHLSTTGSSTPSSALHSMHNNSTFNPSTTTTTTNTTNTGTTTDMQNQSHNNDFENQSANGIINGSIEAPIELD